MAKLVLVLTHDVADFAAASGNRRNDVRSIINYLEAVNGGAKSASTLSITPNAVAASGTITIAAGNLSDGNSVFIGSSSASLTARNSVTLPGSEFAIGADNVETAANLAAKINDSTIGAAWKGSVVATVLSNVVTVTAVVPGIVGNGIGMNGSGANLTFSGTRLASGAGTAVVDSF